MDVACKAPLAHGIPQARIQGSGSQRGKMSNSEHHEESPSTVCVALIKFSLTSVCLSEVVIIYLYNFPSRSLSEQNMFLI